MQHESNNTPESSTEASQQSRRKFLTRATAGVVIASLPAKSVWAAGGNILNSIVASGHGSDFAGGKRVQLLSQGLVKTQLTQYHNVRFSSVFGGAPFQKGTIGITVPDSTLYTFKYILDNAGKKVAGTDNVNLHMIALYVAADITRQSPVNNYGIYYPVVKTGGFATSIDFAKHLYNAVKAGSISGKKLNEIITCYHVKTTGTGSCGIL